MAFKSGGGDDLNAEINVTPMVDVMLVLLIIFMITAPMMNTGVQLELPASPSTRQEDVNGKLIVSIKADGAVFIGGTQVPWKSLQEKLTKNERVQKEPVYIEADASLPYSVVVTAMAMLQEAKCPGVMLLTNESDKINVDALDAGQLKNTKP